MSSYVCHSVSIPIVISLFIETTDGPPLCTQGQLPHFFWSSHFGEVIYASCLQ